MKCYYHIEVHLLFEHLSVFVGYPFIRIPVFHKERSDVLNKHTTDLYTSKSLKKHNETTPLFQPKTFKRSYPHS